MTDDDRATPMTRRGHVEWFHGSPERLQFVRAGSTVTPVMVLAKAFSHKPTKVEIEVRENTDARQRRVSITHDGTRSGFLYRVLTEDPSTDLKQHPGSTGARGEEVLTTRDIPVALLEELSLSSSYEVTEGMESE